MDFCVHIVDVKSIIIVISTIVKDLTKIFPRDFLYCMCFGENMVKWFTFGLYIINF